MADIQQNVIKHAQSDMAADPAASHDKPEPSLIQRVLAKRNEWAAEQPSLGGQLAAMWREAVKDVRQTLNETYFGKPEHMPEAGTPMNPTQIQVTAEQGNFHGYNAALYGVSYDASLDQAANEAAHRGQGADRGASR